MGGVDGRPLSRYTLYHGCPYIAALGDGGYFGRDPALRERSSNMEARRVSPETPYFDTPPRLRPGVTSDPLCVIYVYSSWYVAVQEDTGPETGI